MSGKAARAIGGSLIVLAMVACGQTSQHGGDTASGTAGVLEAVSSSATAGAAGTRAAAGATAAASLPARSGLGDRTDEALNPDDNTVVFLYHELAGVAPPIDQWVEADSRVSFVTGPNKAARRSEVRAELEAAAAAVRNIGFIRLSMNADLSEYDPAYGEFTVRALAPSSVVTFKAFNEKISLRFGNGRDAQVWAVSPEQAAAVRDELGYGRGVSLDALLRISGVQPAPSGGTLVTEVVEYEMRVAGTGKLLGRVRLAAK